MSVARAALRELESRCCQLGAREIDSRAEIRTRSIAQSQASEMRNVQIVSGWSWVGADEIGSRSEIRRPAIALNLKPNHQLRRIQRSIYMFISNAPDPAPLF